MKMKQAQRFLLSEKAGIVGAISAGKCNSGISKVGDC